MISAIRGAESAEEDESGVDGGVVKEGSLAKSADMVEISASLMFGSMVLELYGEARVLWDFLPEED